MPECDYHLAGAIQYLTVLTWQVSHGEGRHTRRHGERKRNLPAKFASHVKKEGLSGRRQFPQNFANAVKEDEGTRLEALTRLCMLQWELPDEPEEPPAPYWWDQVCHGPHPSQRSLGHCLAASRFYH